MIGEYDGSELGLSNGLDASSGTTPSNDLETSATRVGASDAAAQQSTLWIQQGELSPLGQLMGHKVGLEADGKRLPENFQGYGQAGKFEPSEIAAPSTIRPDSISPGLLGKMDSEMNREWYLDNVTPLLPPGVDIAANVDEAHKNGGLYWVYNQERNKGPWDFKQLGNEYEKGGNFHYGVIAEAAGVPSWLIMRAPGIAQMKAGTSSADFGKPWGGPPYGDDPADQYWIQRGRDYYDRNFREAGASTGWRERRDRLLGGIR